MRSGKRTAPPRGRKDERGTRSYGNLRKRWCALRGMEMIGPTLSGEQGALTSLTTESSIVLGSEHVCRGSDCRIATAPGYRTRGNGYLPSDFKRPRTRPVKR